MEKAIMGVIAAAGVFSLFGAKVIQTITLRLCKFTPEYSTAYWSNFTANIAGLFILELPLIYLAQRESALDQTPISYAITVILIAVSFLSGTAIYAMFIRHPQTGAVGFLKAGLINLVQFVLCGFLFAITCVDCFLIPALRL